MEVSDPFTAYVASRSNQVRKEIDDQMLVNVFYYS